MPRALRFGMRTCLLAMIVLLASCAASQPAGPAQVALKSDAANPEPGAASQPAGPAQVALKSDAANPEPGFYAGQARVIEVVDATHIRVEIGEAAAARTATWCTASQTSIARIKDWCTRTQPKTEGPTVTIGSSSVVVFVDGQTFFGATAKSTAETGIKSGDIVLITTNETRRDGTGAYYTGRFVKA